MSKAPEKKRLWRDLPSSEQLEIIQHIRAVGRGSVSWRKLAADHGMNEDTLRRAADPVWAETRRNQINSSRQAERAGQGSAGQVERKAKRLAAGFVKPPILPADTRSITGQLFGDPLPGRSALDMEQLGVNRSYDEELEPFTEDGDDE